MIQLIPHFRIAPSPLNPRKRFDEAGLKELAESIRQEGLLQNLVVRPSGDMYEIAAGERRWRAILELFSAGHLPSNYEVPCRVVDLTDLQLLQLATTENLARADMTPLEEARAFQRMLELGSDVATISAETGLSERTVRTRLALTERLSPTAIERLEDGTLTLGQAQALTSGSKAAQDRLLEDRTSHTGTFDVTPASIRYTLKWQAIPVSRAKFDVAKYQGEIIPASLFDPESEPTFADVDQFHALQREYVDELKAEAERQGKWVEVDQYFPRYQFDTVDEDGADPEKAGVFIVLRTDGEVEIHEGLVRIERESYRSESAKPQEKDPLALTEKHRTEIQLIRTRAAQRQVSDNTAPNGTRLAIAALVTSGFYSVRLGHSRGLAREYLDPEARAKLEWVDELLGLDPEVQYYSPRDQLALLEQVLERLRGLTRNALTDVLDAITASLIHFGVDGTWVDGQKRDGTADIVMRYVDGNAALPTWRDLGADWLLMYPKARLEQIYQEATGQEPGASLTRKNMAAGILDHAQPGWLDQVPAELLVTDPPKSDAELVPNFRAEEGELEELQAAAEELECRMCGDLVTDGDLIDDLCSDCHAEQEEEGEPA